MQRWIKQLNNHELNFLRQIIEADFKLKNYQANTGTSYFVAKRQLANLQTKIAKYSAEESEFKQYLDYLVFQNAVAPSIAEVIYKKHLQELHE
ncbi:hypothetical protein JOC36_001648 [Weissella uvarum]|uniref:hypothetical protein n=1 Tax=Weissella uvarum TaxID=1479233 RepID=UPI00195F7AE6|nr:hypothetical protein [Weissella uvarum]MBM7618048.1 hypothetical protein [Weissella uvarum]MCM0595095.1 hypothetical protein [Weissella uvarum]